MRETAPPRCRWRSWIESTSASSAIVGYHLFLSESFHDNICYIQSRSASLRKAPFPPTVDALRDLKLIRKALKTPGLRDLVVELTYLHSEQPGMAALLADAGLLSLHDLRPSSSAPDLLKVPKNWDFRGTFLEDEKLRRKRKSEAFWRRLFMAAFGGAALIAPMLIMSLHPTKVTNLVTASAFVVVVAVLAYVMTEATPQDIISATAAYAAVFVGTSVSSH